MLHTVAPASASKPAGHAVQALAPVVSALYVPAGQAVHTIAPGPSELYCPLPHAVHVVGAEAPTSDEYVPAEHTLQAVVDVVFAQAPAGHAVQARLVPAVVRLL